MLICAERTCTIKFYVRMIFASAPSLKWTLVLRELSLNINWLVFFSFFFLWF